MKAEIFDIMKDIASSHFVGGVAGGLVRAFFIKEAYGVAMIRGMAGGATAFYLSPVIIWLLLRKLEVDQGDLLAVSHLLDLSISFSVGVMGMMLSTVIEKVIYKWAGIK